MAQSACDLCGAIKQDLEIRIEERVKGDEHWGFYPQSFILQLGA